MRGIILDPKQRIDNVEVRQCSFPITAARACRTDPILAKTWKANCRPLSLARFQPQHRQQRVFDLLDLLLDQHVHLVGPLTAAGAANFFAE